MIDGNNFLFPDPDFDRLSHRGGKLFLLYVPQKNKKAY